MKNNGKLYNFIVLSFATGLGTGYSPIASGTTGTLIVGIPLYLLLSLLPTSWYLVILFLLLLISAFLCEAGERVLGEKDSHKVVIDEVCGFLVTMAFIPKNLYTIVAGFLLFRLFDIVKPQPSKWMEDNLPGGLGVLMDDVVAGVYANILIRIGMYILKVV